MNNIIYASFNPRCTARTAEIMSRYRPIAPKPEPVLPLPPPTNTTTITPTPTLTIAPSSPAEVTSAHAHAHPLLSRNIRPDAPCLMNLWPQPQPQAQAQPQPQVQASRPIRTRKRGRTVVAPPNPNPIMIKRPRTHLIAISPSFPLQAIPGFPQPPHQFVAIPGLVALHEYIDINSNSSTSSNHQLITLPLLPSIPILPSTSRKAIHTAIDLNKEASSEIPEEKDFLQQLQQGQGNNTSTNFFIPQPIRPICSSICVGTITRELGLSLVSSVQSVPIPMKSREEIEQELESEALPTVVSDINNRVRLANSAYKEMVGQPVCSWLDACACKRICGEVKLHISKSNTSVLASTNGFSCWVIIEWGSKDGFKIGSVTAHCDVKKLSCEAKEYLYAWRFRTGSEACESSSQFSST